MAASSLGRWHAWRVPSVIDGPAGAGSASEAGPGGEAGSGSERRAYDVATAAHPRVPRHLHQQIWSDLRWSFRPPWVWLSGIVFNLVLSLLYLIVDPLSDGPHRNWAILVGSYFAVFVLADVTTTNVLGADAVRVTRALAHDISLQRILLVKNLTLLVIVGLPTAIATAAITLATETSYDLSFTIPGVIFPILTWIGVGNLVSVALPVAALPLQLRWAYRRDWRRTLRWAVHLGLPYLIYLLVSPVSSVPRLIDSQAVLAVRSPQWRGVTLSVTGLAFWVLGTVLALALARRRAVHFDDLPTEEIPAGLWSAFRVLIRHGVRLPRRSA